MNLLTLFLCALVIQAKSQHDGGLYSSGSSDVFPARILAHQKTLSENSSLHITCSTYGLKKHKAGFVYVCLNGIGVDKKNQKEEDNDSTFVLHKVGLDRSGTYSCVYSENNYQPSAINATGHNTFEVLVIANFHPANISLSGPSSVSQGDHVEFLCTVPDVLQTVGQCDLIQSYLMQDGTIVQVQGFHVKQMKASFTVKGASQRDSGHYSCLVLPSRCFQEDRPTGNNEVSLQVRDSFPLVLTVLLTVVTVMLLFGVFFWAINKADLCTSRAMHLQTNADNIEEPQRLTERGEEHFETEEDSFDCEEEEKLGYQNLGSVEHVPCNFEAVYDEVRCSEDASAEDPSAVYYAKISRHQSLHVKGELTQ